MLYLSLWCPPLRPQARAIETSGALDRIRPNALAIVRFPAGGTKVSFQALRQRHETYIENFNGFDLEWPRKGGSPLLIVKNMFFTQKTLNTKCLRNFEVY